MDKNKDELVQRAKNLKQKDKLKLYNIIIDAFADGANIENTINQTLIWCDKLCD